MNIARGPVRKVAIAGTLICVLMALAVVLTITRYESAISTSRGATEHQDAFALVESVNDHLLERISVFTTSEGTLTSAAAAKVADERRLIDDGYRELRGLGFDATYHRQLEQLIARDRDLRVVEDRLLATGRGITRAELREVASTSVDVNHLVDPMATRLDEQSLRADKQARNDASAARNLERLSGSSRCWWP